MAIGIKRQKTIKKLRMVKNKSDEPKISISSPQLMNDTNKLSVSEYAKAAAFGVLETIRLRKRLPENLKKKFVINENEVRFASNFILEENYKYMGASIVEYYGMVKSQVQDPIAMYILWLAYVEKTTENTLDDFDQKMYGTIARSISDYNNLLHEMTGIPKSAFASLFKSRINEAIRDSKSVFWI